MEQARSAPLTVGTTGLLGEGIDCSSWQALILATPFSSANKLKQAIGRVIRPAIGKSRGYIADFIDSSGLSVSSYRKRLEVYRQQGYFVIDG